MTPDPAGRRQLDVSGVAGVVLAFAAIVIAQRIEGGNLSSLVQPTAAMVVFGGTTAALSGVLNAGWKYGAQPRRLLTFALDGRESLPPSAPRDFTVNAVDDPSLVLDEKAVAEGRALSVMCIACHGADLVGAGSPGPDLRESRLALSAESLWSVLHYGSLAPRGMPAFPMLSRAQVSSLQAAIRAAARESLGTRKPGEQGGIPRS